jgi:hypothetical protein
MIFVKQKNVMPDIGDLVGDPFMPEGTIVHDRPDLSAVNANLEQYDRWVDAQAAAAGVLPGSEAYETVTQAIRAKDMIGGDVALMQHGHQMPMQRRDFLEHSGQTVRDVVGQQQNFADNLWNEYASIYGAEAANDERLGPAVEYTMEHLQWQGENPARYAREHPRDFLRDVDLARQLGHRPSRSDTHDSGRTSGIGGSGGYAPEPSTTDGTHPYDNPDSVGMVAELRALQRTRGIL